MPANASAAMTGASTKMAAGADCADHPAAPTNLMGSSQNLEALPTEILQEVIKLVVPVNQVISVRYPHPDQSRDAYDARSLMLSSRTLCEATAPIFYGRNTFKFDQNPGDELPIFLLHLRESTLCSLRRVQIFCFSSSDLTYGLDLLLGCHSLESLKIDTHWEPLTKCHQRVLKCFRLKEFEISTIGVEPNRGEWLHDIPGLLTSKEPLTPWQRKRVEQSGLAKVRAKPFSIHRRLTSCLRAKRGPFAFISARKAELVWHCLQSVADGTDAPYFVDSRRVSSS